jgi:hypothetical protein
MLKYVMSVAQRACGFHTRRKMGANVNRERTLSHLLIPGSALYRLERGGAVSHAHSAHMLPTPRAVDVASSVWPIGPQVTTIIHGCEREFSWTYQLPSRSG